jgi:addiction module RelE/StbE family toxin
MVEIKFIVATEKFEKDVKKIKDRRLKIRIEKQVRKIIETPEVGKPLRYNLKGEHTIYIKPYRLIYKVEEDRLILLRCEHREIVYGRH